jgi:hypothetical protein
MVRIAISVEAFKAIARTLPLGYVDYEADANERGERYVWHEDAMAARLGAMRGPGRATAASSCGSSGWTARARRSSAGQRRRAYQQ